MNRHRIDRVSLSLFNLVAGQVQVSVQSLPSSIALIRSGKIKVLGVVNQKRLAGVGCEPDKSPPNSLRSWCVTICRAGRRSSRNPAQRLME